MIAADNTNFWGHPTLASGDQGGRHPDWGFSWGPDPDGVNKIWFGVGEDTGGGTPTATATGADPFGDGNVDVWYVLSDVGRKEREVSSQFLQRLREYQAGLWTLQVLTLS